MRAKILLIALSLVLIASNAATFLILRRQIAVLATYQNDFSRAINARAGIDGPFILMIGDSITERSNLPNEICRMPLIKVGVGGSRASSFVPFAEEMNAKNIVPSLIVVALGMNNTVPAYRSDFRTSYNLLIDTLPKAPLILATLTPVDKPTNTTSKVDTIIRDTAAERGLDFIDLGTLRDFDTTDGIHLTERAYISWNEKIISGIKASVCKSDWSPKPSQ